MLVAHSIFQTGTLMRSIVGPSPWDSDGLAKSSRAVVYRPLY